MQITYSLKPRARSQVASVGEEVSLAQINALQDAMREMPQAPSMDTTHHFAGGMYCRRIEIPQGTAIVSKVHKTEHLFIGCIGELQVAGQGETYVLKPGDIVVSAVGTKRAVLALTDAVVLTVHKTDKTTADQALEDELIEFDALSNYDVDNKVKPGVLQSAPATKELEV